MAIIKLNGIELKKVFDINLDMLNREMVVKMYHDDRMKGLTDLSAFQSLLISVKTTPPTNDEVSVVEVRIPFNETSINIQTRTKAKKDIGE